MHFLSIDSFRQSSYISFFIESFTECNDINERDNRNMHVNLNLYSLLSQLLNIIILYLLTMINEIFSFLYLSL